MKNSKIIAVIPARAGSERVKRKNTRSFAGFKKGLLELKLMQLSKVKEIDKIIISSNDNEVLDFVDFFSQNFDSRCRAIKRPDILGSSETPMSEFITYLSNLEKKGVMLMTHVTHPFITSEVLSKIISKYKKIDTKKNDSLITTTRIYKFLWNKKGPFNYNRKLEKWPRSQDLTPLFEINHGAYVIPFKLMRRTNDRIGYKPLFYNLPESIAMDIDWEDQFNYMESIALSKKSNGLSLL